ncbi:MAG: M20/M25/M40 family metallo-hydrolase [Flavobacteriales bacterium]|nr:M20/M25/M40 family metallo-hydrolase [Flavobacteriales bacterium]
MRSLLIPFLLSACSHLHAQVVYNIQCTSTEALHVMKGLHDPATYAADTVIDDHARILCELRERLRTDSLRSYLERLDQFHTRQSYSDTVSATTGIGAARRWAYTKFQQFSAANEDRLIPAYLQFDYQDTEGVCGDALGWRNVLAVLPGSSTTDHRVVLIEAHLDSRCADNCDPTCYAPGMDDNGSGSALVLELARVMSRYTFTHTLVFMLTTGEEQGLVGAEAMATFCVNEGITIKAVQNNDIVGGIVCGHTASPPGCPGPGHVDSTQVKLFSNGAITLPNRGFARTVKLYYQEKMQSQVAVPMTISIMGQEDRTGRGGDHIPFRIDGFRNLRFTSANEHGDAGVDDPGYTDRQHTSGDILGVDTNGDSVIDSLYVDLNYLKRNALINGMSATLLALGPETPTFIVHDEPAGLRVSITSGHDLPHYRIGVRSGGTNLDFTALYLTSDTSFLIPDLIAGVGYTVSVAGVDANGITSPFSREYTRGNDADTPAGTPDPLPFTIDCNAVGIAARTDAAIPTVELLPCRPNPLLDHAFIDIVVNGPPPAGTAHVVVWDARGREHARMPVNLQRGTNTIRYQHRGMAGVYPYGLVIDGRTVARGSMVLLK